VKSCPGSNQIIEVVGHTWPKQKQGTTAAPAWIATFTKPNLFLRYTTCQVQEAQDGTSFNNIHMLKPQTDAALDCQKTSHRLKTILCMSTIT